MQTIGTEAGKPLRSNGIAIPQAQKRHVLLKAGFFDQAIRPSHIAIAIPKATGIGHGVFIHGR